MARVTRFQVLTALSLTTVTAGAVGCSGARSGGTPGVVQPAHAAEIERARQIVGPLTGDGVGVAVAVGVSGELIWSEGFGHRSLGGPPVAPDDPFRVYSLMKPLTAVLSLEMAGRGEIDLRAPVREVLPVLPPQYRGVTPLHLLTHTSGVRHYRDAAEAALTAHCSTAAEALPGFIYDPLVGEPGAGESYSTWGFVLLSAALERAAGIPFDSLVAERLFRPAGVEAAHLEGEGREVGIRYYEVDETGALRPAPPVDNSCKMGGGGFVASAPDLVRMYNAVIAGEIVPPAAVRQLLRGRTVLESGGSGPGGQAVSLVDLERGLSVVLVSNTSGDSHRQDLGQARQALAELFGGDGTTVP